MKKSLQKETYQTAITTVLQSLTIPLSSLISQLIKTFDSSNEQIQTSQKDLNLLSRVELFDSSIDCLIDKFVSFLLINPNDFFPLLFLHIPIFNLDPNFKFSNAKEESQLINKFKTEFKTPTLLSRAIAFFVIDKLYVTIFLRFLDQVNPDSSSSPNSCFTEFFSLFFSDGQASFAKTFSSLKPKSSPKRQNEMKIRNININCWSKIIHKLSLLYPFESFYIFTEVFSTLDKTRSEWAFAFNLFRCFDFKMFSIDQINQITNYGFFAKAIEPCFKKITECEDIHISVSLFLLNFVGHQIIDMKMPNSKPIKEIIKYIKNYFSKTPVVLPVTAFLFTYFSRNQQLNELGDDITATRIITEASDTLSHIQYSGVIVLNTFSQLLINDENFFIDIYTNGIRIPRTFPEYSLIDNEIRDQIFHKIASYGSFNNALLELTFFFISYAFIDFHYFISNKLEDLLKPVFMRFKSFQAIYLFREILLNEILKEKYQEDFASFQKRIAEFLANYISANNNKPIMNERFIYSLDPWIFRYQNRNENEDKIKEVDFDYYSEFQKQNCSYDFFIKHIFEFIEPKSVSVSLNNSKINLDISQWGKLFMSKTSRVFSEIKKAPLSNCKMLRENQNTAFIFSIIPLIEVDEKMILFIVPYLFDRSPQISANALFIIQLSIHKDPVLIEKVIDLMLTQEFSYFEILYNSLYFISIFINAAFSSKKEVNHNDIMKNVFNKIEELIIIGLSSNENIIRKVTFSIIKSLNYPEFKIFYDEQCFKRFAQKMKAITFPQSQNMKISELPFRSYYEVSQTKYETIHSIYLSVIFDHLSIRFKDNKFKMIRHLQEKLETLKDKQEYQHFYVNILTFLAIFGDNDDSLHAHNKLLDEIKNIEYDQGLFISFGSAFPDVTQLTNYFVTNLPFEKHFSLFPAVALITWERFPTDNTIDVFLRTIADIIDQGFQNEIKALEDSKENGNGNNDQHEFPSEDKKGVVLCILTLFSKMFSSFSKKHKTLTSSIFLRSSVCEDIFRFCRCLEKEELIFKFCLLSANSPTVKKEGEKALESFCAVTSYYKNHLQYFEDLKKFPKAIRAIFSQSPQCIEFLLDQIKTGDNSSFSTLSALFHPISSILDSADSISENLIHLYKFGLNEKSIENDSTQKEVICELLSDIDFSNMIYNLTGKIIAVCLWNFPSSDSINTLLNLTLSFALIRIFLLNDKDKRNFKTQIDLSGDKSHKAKNENRKDDDFYDISEEKINDTISNFSSLIHFLNNPSYDIHILSNLLSLCFDFCLDQFLREAFDLLNKSFSSNFVLALTPWMTKIDLNLEKLNDSLSPNTESCFKFYFTSMSFVETIDKFNLYELVDVIININHENIESLFIIGIKLRKPELIHRVLKNAPECSDFICPYFNCNYWRYQVVQLRKLGDKSYYEYSGRSGSTTSKESLNQYADNEDIFDVTHFLLKEVVPLLITDNFNELSFIYKINKSQKEVFHFDDDLLNDESNSIDFETSSSSVTPRKSLTESQQLNAFKMKSILDHVLTYCIIFKKNKIVSDFVKKYFYISHFFKYDESTFRLLFDWATICGDIEVSNSAASYLVEHFSSFSIDSISCYFGDFIERIMQTITIMCLSIHDKNTTKTTQFTGDSQRFSYNPYYAFISTLMSLLSDINTRYFESHLEKKSENKLSARVFWFFSEFVVASDKSFGGIFRVAIDSIYKHVKGGLPISDISDISPHNFNGIIPSIVKYDSLFNKNEIVNIIEEIIEISVTLFSQDKLYHLVGNLDRFTQGSSAEADFVLRESERKKYIATIGLFLLPFSNYSTYFTRSDDEKDGDAILDKVVGAFGEDDLHISTIQNLVEEMLNCCEMNLIETVLLFYFFIVKYHPSRVHNAYDVCAILLSCKNVSLGGIDSQEGFTRTRSNSAKIFCTNSSTNLITTNNGGVSANSASSFNINKVTLNDNDNNDNGNSNCNDDDLPPGDLKNIVIHKSNFLRLIKSALCDKEVVNAAGACSFIQAFYKLGGSFEDYSVSLQTVKFPIEELPFDLEQIISKTRRSSMNRKMQQERKKTKKSASNPLVAEANNSSSSGGNDNESMRKVSSFDAAVAEARSGRSEDEELPGGSFDAGAGGPAVFFPTGQQFNDLPFVSDVREAVISQSKIEPFTKWDEEITNAERARDKIEMLGNQEAQQELSASSKSELKFDFTKLFSSRQSGNSQASHESSNNNNDTNNDNNNNNDTNNDNNNNNDTNNDNNNNNDSSANDAAGAERGGGGRSVRFGGVDGRGGAGPGLAMDEACNRFRLFVKQSLSRRAPSEAAAKAPPPSDAELRAAAEKPGVEDGDAQDGRKQPRAEEASAESLFFVSPLLFTPDEKEIDAIGSNDFPTVFP